MNKLFRLSRSVRSVVPTFILFCNTSQFSASDRLNNHETTDLTDAAGLVRVSLPAEAEYAAGEDATGEEDGETELVQVVLGEPEPVAPRSDQLTACTQYLRRYCSAEEKWPVRRLLWERWEVITPTPPTVTPTQSGRPSRSKSYPHLRHHFQIDGLKSSSSVVTFCALI